MKNQTLALMIMVLLVLPLASAFKISGTVTDNYGNLVSGATVVCYNVTTTNSNTTTTSSTGAYSFALVNDLAIDAGVYTCNATLTDAATRTTKYNTGENVTVVASNVTRAIVFDEFTYTNTYASTDLAPITIDILGLTGAQVVAMVAIIAFITLLAWSSVKYKKIGLKV